MGSMVIIEERLGLFTFSNNTWDSSLRCPVGAHWGCLAASQRDEVLKAAKQRDLEQWEIARANGDDSTARPRSAANLQSIKPQSLFAVSRSPNDIPFY